MSGGGPPPEAELDSATVRLGAGTEREDVHVVIYEQWIVVEGTDWYPRDVVRRIIDTE